MSASDPRPEGTYDDYGPYHYPVTEWVCIVFIVAFSVSTIIHLGQTVRYRLWWLLVTAVFCGFGEILGWSARLWSSINPRNRTGFLMQISTTIFSPTFLLASHFIILGRIIRILGVQYSRLSPKAYGYIFLTADFAALLVQAIGGGQASAALTLEDANRGGRVMLGGIALQFAVLVIYVIVASEFLVRASRNRPVRPDAVGATSKAQFDDKLTRMIVGLGLSAVLLFIRTIYRTVELEDGWNGKIITNQTLFNVCDGLMIALAMFTLNIFHPGPLVYNKDRILASESDSELQEKPRRFAVFGKRQTPVSSTEDAAAV